MFEFLEVTPVELEEPKVDTSNWQRIFFDLEGSLDTRGDIIQVAAITTDWDFNITNVFNMYFKNSKPILEEELRVHGITEEYLKQYATGHFTEQLEVTPFYPDKPTMFISYTTFDIKRINAELSSYGITPINFGQEKTSLISNMYEGVNCYLDAFQYGKKKGVVISKELGDEIFDGIYKELSEFGDFARKSNHDALYDSVMILALCRGVSDDRTRDTNTER
ncbi:exonuclease domain-containing protein [Lysinibacillus xylanilyticus]|uniref:exonuclease domain-containing protein n=1 Tax=Lysinibacillus xylanilyticus TaxID=582475 RepID=UPI0036DB5DC3